MTMVKSRRANKGGVTGKRFRPVVADLVSNEEVERYVDEQYQHLEAASKGSAMAAEAFGLVKALQFNMDVLLEHAFQRIASLEAQLAKAKAAPAMSYKGVWKPAEQTLPGQFVTFQGSVWHCNKKTMSRPGDEPGAFTLAVKRGQDGKDAQ